MPTLQHRREAFIVVAGVLALLGLAAGGSALLLNAAPVGIRRFAGVLFSRRAVVPAEVRWMRRGMLALDELRDVLKCFRERHGELPADADELFESGCMPAGTTLKASYEGVYEMPLAGSPEWMRVDEVLVRRRSELPLASNAIVAVMMPHARYPTRCVVLDWSGTLEVITQADWNDRITELRARLGGAELWP